MISKQTMYQQPDSSREAALAGTPLATFTRRAIALLIDFWVAGIMFVFVAIAGIFIGEWTGFLTPNSDEMIKFGFYDNWYSVAWLVLYFTLSVYLDNGRTVGKRICRIRVVSMVHDHIGLWHAFERALGYGASTLELGFGFLQYFIRPDRRTIHDRIAETIVIAEPAKKRKK